MFKIPVEVSARHIHLSQKDLNKLFGENYELRTQKQLSQVGQFAAEETVKLIGPKGEINNVRILGPVREKTQIEVSITDFIKLGIKPVLRASGDLIGSANIIITSSASEIESDGLIVAKRHLHLSPNEAKVLGVKNGQEVKIRVSGPREIIFGNVLVRVDDNFKLSFQLDTDEANAAYVIQSTFGELVK